MQQKTLYRSLVMKLEHDTQANEEIDEAVHRSASAYRGSRESSFLVLQVIKTETLVERARFASWFSIDLQSARIVWFERERKSAQDTEQKSVQIVCNSYEDPNVDDMKQISNSRDDSEDSGGCSTSPVLD